MAFRKREEPFRYHAHHTPRIESREYKIFKEEERVASLPRTFYEKACKLSNRIMNVEPDEKTRKKLQEAINFSHLKITPNDVASLTLMFTFFVCFPTIILLVLNLFLGLPGLSLGYALLVIFLALPFAYYLYMYPLHLKKKYEMEAGAAVVTMIMYIAMYMRNIPNIEGAVRFASENMTGPLAYELRKLVWDVETGNYLTMEQALGDYTRKWSGNREFVEAIEIIITSMRQTGERRLDMLNESVDIILAGNRENAKHFNQALKTHVMVVHALGIILPVLGLVLFPIVALFLGVEASVLFIGYDVLLPIALFFVINNILEKRPATFSKIDISLHPNIPPEGKFLYHGKFLSAKLIALLVAVIILTFGFMLFLTEGGMLSAIVITGGIAFSLGLYSRLLSSQRMVIRATSRQIEDEFAESLFQMGNQVSSGIPIELSMEHSLSRIEALQIKDLFKIALNNMKTMGFTFTQAFFDSNYGAIRYYPSRLISSIMRTVTEAAKKGMGTASMAMLSVSKYLKNIHKTQEDVRDELTDTVSSMKFQAFILSPLISGVVVTLALVVMSILEQLAAKVEGVPVAIEFISGLSSSQVTPFQFIFIVAVYLIETCIILAIFINGIENGEDPIGRQDIMSKALIIGFLAFAAVVFVTFAIFQPLIIAVVP